MFRKSNSARKSKTNPVVVDPNAAARVIASLKEPQPSPYDESNLPHDFFDEYPADLCLHFLQYLSLPDVLHVCQVSRRFRALAGGGGSLDAVRIDFAPFLDLRSARIALRVFQRRGSRHRHVNLGRIRLTEDVPLSTFVPLFSPNLVSFSCDAVVGKKYVRDVAIRLLSERCAQLERINLFGCWLLSDESLSAIAQGCPKLRSLHIGSCHDVTDLGITLLAKGCAHLEELNVWKCHLLTDKALESLGKGCPNLRTLTISECQYVSNLGINFFSPDCKIYF